MNLTYQGKSMSPCQTTDRTPLQRFYGYGLRDCAEEQGIILIDPDALVVDSPILGLRSGPDPAI